MQSIINETLHPLFLRIESMIGQATQLVWYYPVVFLCIFCAVFFTIYFKGIQFRGFGHALALVRGNYDNPNETGHITHFQALMAALSGTIGLGNIAGVAIAISMGGPGTIFWMWVMGLLGMATKFVECTLGTKYRHQDPVTGNVYGGPMYYITKKMPRWCAPLAWLFAGATIFGAFGAGGMFQSNQAASALYEYFGIHKGITGLFLAGAVALVIIGGINRIGRVAGRIVPTMCIIYIVGALFICVLNIQQIPGIIRLIIHDAFTGNAVAGGAVGTVLIWGIRRAVFSNEAGLGSASIAHAAVKTNYPIREGFVASLGPLIDTIIVCTATAIVIVLSGYYTHHDYEPTNAMITFETPTDMTETPHWSIQKNTQTNNHALVHQPSTNITAVKTPMLNIVHQETTWYNTPITRILGDGIQFSTKSGNGNYAVILRNSMGSKIADFRLSGDEKLFFVSSFKDHSSPLQMVHVTLSHSTEKNGWQTHTLSFNQDAKAWITENKLNHSMQLEFIADKNSAPIHIDNIFIGKPRSGIPLTIAAFDSFIHGFGSIFISFAVVLFAFSTMITWSYYGEVALKFLTGSNAILPFKWIFVIMIFLGARFQLATVLNFSDLMIGLMVIPNVIAILWLSSDVWADCHHYLNELSKNTFKRFK